MGDNLPPISFPFGLKVDQMVRGWYHAGMISTTGSLFMWGRNNFGGLGLGHSNNIGVSGSEMGEYLQETQVGAGMKVFVAQSGLYHTCVILDNYEMKCFGLNSSGQLGYGDSNHRGNDPNELGDYLPEVNLGSGLTAQSLHLGQSHSCVLLNDDSFKCFGENFDGQLGIGNTNSQGDQLNEMGDYLGPINLGTGAEIQECFDYSPTSSPSLSSAPSFFSIPKCSSQFSFLDSNCILTSSSQLKCFGANPNGQLGYGDATNRGDFANQMGNYLPFISLGTGEEIINVQSGSGAFCAQVLAGFQIKCWGYNLVFYSIIYLF